MIGEICAELKNFFSDEGKRRFGEFSISGGTLSDVDFLQNGQYFRVVGSIFNDGVHKWPVDGLIDETFDGAIWPMAVPPDVVQLAADIEEWSKSDAAKPSPYESESFGGYTYTRAKNAKGSAVTWKDEFSSRLDKHRRIRVL